MSTPHVAFVPFTGFRVREVEMLELGMSLPGLSRRGAAIGQLPALGLLALAGCTPAPWTCSYHSAPSVTVALFEEVIAKRPNLVAISALTASIHEAYTFSVRLRQQGIPVVMGGLHATACPDEAIRFCTSVVVGDGESSWPRVLADIQNGHLARCYHSSYEHDLDSPIPRFDLLGFKPDRFTLQTQRGCPWSCEFCGASRLLGRFREKPIESIRRELQAIAAIDPQPIIELADDNTFAGKRNPEELLEALSQSGARWMTESDWRIGERPELVTRLADAGCVQVLVGIESLEFRFPGFGQKQAELPRIMNAIQAIQAAGVAVNGCFIVGADGETDHSLDRLIQFILDSSLAEVQVTLQTPFPGTQLYERLKRQSRLLPERGWDYYTLFDVTYQPDILSVSELEQGFRNVLRHVFSNDATQARSRLRRDIWKRNATFVRHGHNVQSLVT